MKKVFPIQLMLFTLSFALILNHYKVLLTMLEDLSLSVSDSLILWP